jgi:molecular chaperone IbpA
MMRMLDFGPYVRSTVGFDRMFDLLENLPSRDVDDSYPPYNIEKTGDDTYRIIMAVAGFAPEELSVVTNEGQLVVSGRQLEKPDAQFLHRGIGARAFQRQFSLADYVQVAGAHMDNGLLTIDLKREVPEALKPRTISIDSGSRPTSLQKVG